MGAARGPEKKSLDCSPGAQARKDKPELPGKRKKPIQATTKMTTKEEVVGKLLSVKEPTPLHIHSQESRGHY